LSVTDTLCKFGEYPEIYADCLGEVQVTSENVHIVLAR
jgi:hypothetical protein